MALYTFPAETIVTTGLASDANQLIVISWLTSIDGRIAVTNTKLDTLHSDISASNTKLDTLHSDIGSSNTKLDTLHSDIVSSNTKLDTIHSDLAISNTARNIVDQIDSTPLLDTSSTNIPASASSPVQIVASTAAIVTKIVSVEDIGEFIGVYTGAVASEVLLGILPLGGGELDVNIPIATRISLRNMKNSIINSGFIAINFIG